MNLQTSAADIDVKFSFGVISHTEIIAPLEIFVITTVEYLIGVTLLINFWIFSHTGHSYSSLPLRQL